MKEQFSFQDKTAKKMSPKKCIQACKLDKPITPLSSPKQVNRIYHWLEYTTINFVVFSFYYKFCGRHKVYFTFYCMTDCDPYVFTSTLIRFCIDYAVVGDCNHPLSSRSAEQRSVPMNGAASHKKKAQGEGSGALRRYHGS